MSDIKKVLRDACNKLKPKHHFYDGRMSEQNVFVDDAEFPAMLVVDPLSIRVVLNDYGLQTSHEYDLMLVLVRKSYMEWKQKDHDINCIHPEKDFAVKLITYLHQTISETEDIIEVSGISIDPATNLLDVNVSGVILRMKIKLKPDENLCLPELDDE